MEIDKSQSTKIFVASESFINAIKDLPVDDKQSLRLLKNKLFIPESYLQKLLVFYKDWLINAGAGSYSQDKLLNRIFGEEVQALYYLPEGNECQIGYLAIMPAELKSDFIGFKTSNSVPIAARDYLHPRDLSYQSLPGIEFRRPLNQSLQIVFTIGEEKFLTSEPIVRKLAGVLRQSPKILTQYPKILISLRDTLTPLRELFLAAKSVSRSRSVIVPEKYKNDSQVRFLILPHNFIVVLRNQTIEDVFETKGRALSNLIDEELNYLVQKNIKTIDALQIMPHDKIAIGKLKIAGKWYGVERKAFKLLVDKITFSRWFRGKLDKTYTVKDILDNFIPILKNADWVDVTSLGRNVVEESGKKQKPRYELKYSPWTFRTGKNYTISDFIEGGQQGFRSQKDRK